LKIAVVIPTYNEMENIVRLIPQILDVFREKAIDGEVIVVDDASPDGTGHEAAKLALTHDNVSVLNRSSKKGLGSAYKDGFKHALDSGCEGLIEMDADFSHDPLYLPNFISKLNEEYDLVIGSRYITGGDIVGWSFVRKIISTSANCITRLLLALAVKDATSGYRAYSSKGLQLIDYSTVKSDGYAFQVEMVMRCRKAGVKIGEIPLVFVNRKIGESKLNFMEMWRFFRSLIRLTLASWP
jgi:dolichol-phosphate mannosyltransferase